MITPRTKPNAKLPVTFVTRVAHGNERAATWISWATADRAGPPSAPPAATATSTDRRDLRGIGSSWALARSTPRDGPPRIAHIEGSATHFGGRAINVNRSAL